MNCRIIHTLFFFITVLSLPAFFCTKLPTDPAEDPNNSGITLFIKEKNTTAQRTVPRRVGLSIHFNTHLETYHIYSKCSNLDSTFEFHSDNITDTLFFYPTFKTEGQCTLFVDAIFHDKNLDSLSDFFTFQVLPAPPTLLFDNVPDNYITLLNQPDTFEIQIVTKDASEYDLETYASTKPPLDTSRLKLIHSSTPEFYNVVINPDTTDTFSLTLYARIKDKNDDILYLDSTIFMIDVLESLTLFKDISDTILSGKENTEISINLNDYLILSDQEITFTPSFGTITDDTLFTFLPEWGCNPQYTLFIIATNEIGNDTMKLHLNIHPADSTSPQIRLSDSTLTDKTISQSAIAISVITTDDLSGISTVHFITSTDTFESTLSSDSMYTADIIDLPKHVTLPITILATDNSIKSNTSELNIHITYDPTSDDTIKPEINQVSGPSNNSRLTHSSDTLSFSITDSSGIDSIWWTLNHTFVDNISILSTGNYQILFSLSEFDTNKITLFAIDRSANKNISSHTISLDYNTKPSAITLSGPSDNSNGIDTLPTFTWTGGIDQDNDTMFFEVHYGESANALSNRLNTTSQKSIKVTTEQKLLPLSTYYWQVIGWSKTYNDSIFSDIHSFTTLDPSSDDNTGPSIAQVSGPINGTRITSASCTLSVTVSDPSGIDSVTARINNGTKQVLSSDNNNYTFSFTLVEFGQNTIIFSATDKSVQRNTDSLVLLLTLNRSPEITINGINNNGTTTASEGQSLSFVVNVSDPDPLDNPIFLSPSNAPYTNPLNGTGSFDTTTGQFTFTPSYSLSNQSKNDTIKNILFYATDHPDLSCVDTFTINIIIENTNRPPRQKDNLASITKTALLGQDIVDTIHVIDPDDDILSFSQITSFSRSNFSFNPNTGILHYIVDTVTQFSIDLHFSDGLLSDTVTYIIDMQPNAWILPQGTSPTITNGFVKILAKDHCFMMGSNDGDTDEQPPHYVCFSYDFWAGQTEVTQAEFSAAMGTNPSTTIGSNYPVQKVSWKNAIRYCIKKSEELSLENCYDTTTETWTCDFTKNGYRLPTEAEWEYACRGGTTTEFFTGNAIDANYAVFNTDSIKKVKSTQPNPYKLYDFSGNVGEWCYDRHDLDYYSVSPHLDPTGSEDTNFYYRVERGGTFLSATTSDLRSSGRTGHGVNSYYNDNGFRVFKTATNGN